MKYKVIGDENERVIFETEKGEIITLLFADKDNKEAEDNILENLVYCYEQRISRVN